MNNNKLRFTTAILVCFLLILLGISLHAQKLAFPGAEGWAAYTPGGRGGQIIRVSNLNSSGEGSLRQAIAEPGSRIIVFDVAGVIDLQGSEIYVKQPFVTIAGQTAPSSGITIVNGSVSIRTHDVIIQHLKIRPGAAGHVEGWEPDGISTVTASNVIIDHCSTTWAVDENCSASGPRFEGATPDEWRENTSHTITMSNNIIAEGLSNSTHNKGEHSKGTLIHDNVTKVAILNNLYASNVNRSPLFKGGAEGVIVNNYIYNPGSSAMRYTLSSSEWGEHVYQPGKIAVISNFMQMGPSSRDMTLFLMQHGPCQLFMDDNRAKDTSGANIDQYREYSSDETRLVNSKPLWHENIHVISADSLLRSIVQNVGARPWERDNIDSRIITETVNITGKIINSETEVEGLPTSQPVYSSFNESDWNTEYMVRLSPQIVIQEPTNGDLFKSDSTVTARLNTASFQSEIEYAELLVEGETIGRDYDAPYKWDFNHKSSGSCSLVAFVQCKNGMVYASDSIQIAVSEATGNHSDLKKDTDELKLSVYPNPMDDSVSVKYTLTQKKNVEISFFNSNSELVNKMELGVQPQGTHTFTWNRGELPSGTYCVLINAGEYRNAKKIICK